MQTNQEKEKKRFCSNCENVVIPIRIGRAHYNCPKCKSNMTIDIVCQYEVMKEGLSDKNSKDAN